MCRSNVALKVQGIGNYTAHETVGVTVIEIMIRTVQIELQGVSVADATVGKQV